MDGERYLVELELKRIGDFGMEKVNASLKKSERGFDAFKRGWNDFRSGVAPVGDMFDGVVRSAMGLARVGAVIGAGAMFAGAAYGVTNLNNELEKTQISIGTIFSANGMAANVPAGIERAKGVIEQMRIDAQKLPGEFEDLQRIFTTGAIPAFHSGASINEFRELSAKAMAAGKVASMDLHQVAREFAMLMEGRSGAHNVFGMKLLGLSGESASQFNQLAADKRMALISKELDKYTGAIDAFADTYDAQSSTLIDNMKSFGRNATAPTFEAVKIAMKEANAWFDENRQEVREYATTIGYALRDAFIEGKRMLQEYGPLVLHFAEGAYHRFVRIWDQIEPYAERFGDYMKAALEDPNGTIDKLLEVGKIWLALKGGGLLLDTGGAALNAAGGAGKMMSAAGWLGENAGSAVGAAGGATALAKGGAGAMAAGGAFLAAVGGVTAALWQYSELSNDIHHENMLNFKAKADASVREIQRMVKQGATEEAIQTRINEMHDQFLARGQNMADSMMQVQLASLQAAGALSALGGGSTGRGWGMDGSQTHEDWLRNTAPDWLTMPLKLGSQAAATAPDHNAQKHKPKGGGGGIQKVEIVITQNQHPSRIARAVAGHLARLQRNPGASPHVPNYSALEEG